MFGHAKGIVVSAAILETLQEDGYQLPLAQLISVGSDGPNVNKTIWTFINEHMKESDLHGILPFIPCNLHIVHNAFRQGLNIFGEQAEQLVLDLFYFLKASPCRKEDFFETQLGLGLDEGMFIKHVQSHWLTLIPAVKRVLKNWEAVEKYFLIELPRMMAKEKREASLKSNERYKRICHKLKDPEVLVQLHFRQNLESVFHPFLTLFQKEEPLIHILYHKLSELLRTIMFRFLKPGVVGENTGKKLMSVELSKPENQLSDLLIEVGETTCKKALKKLKPGQEKGLLIDMRKFYQTATKYLMDRLPVGSGIVKDISCLNPQLRKADQGMQEVQRAARRLPQIVTEEELPLLNDEWKVYQVQDIPEDWYILGRKDDGTTEYRRVDHYWQKVLDQKNFTGAPRYKVLAKLVKAVLCLAHGNAEVERSLSENKKVLTNERTLLSDASINALRSTKDAIRVTASGQAHMMPITPALMQARRSANSVYTARLAEERELKEKSRRLQEKRTPENEEMQNTAKLLEAKKKSLDEKDRSKKKSYGRQKPSTVKQIAACKMPFEQKT